MMRFQIPLAYLRLCARWIPKTWMFFPPLLLSSQLCGQDAGELSVFDAVGTDAVFAPSEAFAVGSWKADSWTLPSLFSSDSSASGTVVQAGSLERHHVHPGTIGGKPAKHWWEELSLGGYTQVRYGAVLDEGDGASPQLLGDRGIGEVDSLTLRRARLKIQGDVAPHLGVYIQPDLAVAPPGGSEASSTYFAQVRDWYGDIYIDKEKVHRLRVGQSKIPFGFENMQSSSNRAPMDRTDPINVAVAPNERDLAVLYYWTPEPKQHLFHELQNARYKGSGDFGILGLGLFNGQGGSQLDLNSTPHVVARLTWPWEIWEGQICEASVQGLCGELVIVGDTIRPLGAGSPIIPSGTYQNGGADGIWEKRIGGTFVWYPMDFGMQAEWSVGEAPGLSDDQTMIHGRPFYGGYVMAMYAFDTQHRGTLIPYTRWSQLHGSYSTQQNAPYGNNFELASGLEWILFKELELTVEATLVNRVNTTAINQPSEVSYRNFDGSVLRLQAQMNY
jgi:hypothetical protein